MATPHALIDTSELDELRKPLGVRLWSLVRRQPLGTAGGAGGDCHGVRGHVRRGP